jgi:archaellum component FlaC
MTDEMQSVVLEHLRLIRASVDDLKTEVRNFNLRVSSVEHQIGAFQLSAAGQNAEIDHIKGRLDRVEKRLGLQD